MPYTTRSLATLFSLLLLAIGISGCAETGPLGATAGGAQDIGHARNIIEAGGIPDPGFVVAEGLLSEHDIATPEDDCSDPLCLSFGYARAEGIDDNESDLFVHVGMTTGLTADNFARPDLDLVLVLDKSGSMSGESIKALRDGLTRLVAKLGPNDEVMVITFNSSFSTPLPFGRMDGRGKRALLDVINKLEADGGTNIESAIAHGFAAVDARPDVGGRSKRLMLFTDARPNVGVTGQDRFRDLTARYAEKEIGLSVFGVGIDFGQDLVYHISRLRGGNFFFLQNAERIRNVFDEEFDLLVTPIVHDLKITIPTPPGARLKAIYGLPDQDSGANETVLEIPTVFFSKNRGAIILRYERVNDGEYAIEQGEDVVDGTIRYTFARDNRSVDRSTKATHTAASPGTNERYFSHGGTRLGVALTNVYLGLYGACLLHSEGESAAAIVLLNRAITYALEENVVMMNAGLDKEIELMRMLRGNIEADG